MNQAEKAMLQIKEMLLRLGFKETMVKNEYRSSINYVYGDLYCDITYLETLGFIIGYANSYEEAEKYWHNDGEAFPLAMGEDAILAGLEKEVLAEIERSQQ